MSFQDELEKICQEVPGSHAALVMSLDGINVAKHLVQSDLDAETLLIELALSLKQTMQVMETVEADQLQEMLLTSSKGCVVVRLLRDEYFAALLLDDKALVGKGRFALRVHSPALLRELS